MRFWTEKQSKHNNDQVNRQIYDPHYYHNTNHSNSPALNICLKPVHRPDNSLQSLSIVSLIPRLNSTSKSCKCCEKKNKNKKSVFSTVNYYDRVFGKYYRTAHRL